MRILVYIAALAATSAFAQDARIFPERPVSEPVDAGQDFNFDILVHNGGVTPLRLERLEIRYLDVTGTAVWQRTCDGQGSAPCIDTIANRDVKPGESQLYFNPFPRIAAAFAVHEVRAELTFNSADNGKRELGANAQVSARNAAVVRLPVRDRVRALNGHDALAHHRRWNFALPYLSNLGFARTNAMRYSYDFVLDGEQSRGAAVLAAADGTVVTVVNDKSDDRSFDPVATRTDVNALFGNYIVIDQGNGTFALYGHLEKGSVRVKAGDRVRPGTPIAKIGESGSVDRPHLHFQLMDGPDMRAEGVPALFSDFVRLRGVTRERVKRGAIGSGDVVEAR